MLNAIWLDTFVTLCDAAHFTRAAQRMNMTQPGVSQHLRKLEAQVGQALISRDGKRFIPTPAGEAVLALGRRRRMEEAKLHQSLQHDAPDVGNVTLACSGSVALLLYPHLITRMRQAPKLQINLEAAPQTRVIDGVVQGDFDLGITDHSAGHQRLSSTRIGADELCLILPADANPAPDFASLESLGFINHPDGPAYADALLAANFPDDYRGATQLQQRSYINQIGQIPTPVAQGIGYTILPRSGIDAYPQRDQVQVIPLKAPIQHDLWLIQRKARVIPSREKQLCALIAGLLSA